MDIQSFWNAVITQDKEKLRTFFHKNAYINWHCTNERFSLEEYLRANCEYPGKWTGEIERIEKTKGLIVLAGIIISDDRKWSLHFISFIKLQDDKIITLDEYFADNVEVPKWRLDKKIGTKIK